MDVEPFPRLKLMKLYYMILDELKQLPEEYEYKVLSEEMTKYRMKIVDENTNIRAIEDKIAAGLIEELVFQAHNELKLLKIMKNWQPWNYLFKDDPNEAAQLDLMLNFTRGNPFPATYERFDHHKSEPAPRKPSAALHPE